MVDDYNNPTDEGVSLNPQPVEDKGVPLDDPNKPLPPAIAADRATKATFGLRGKVDKGYDDYYNAFVSGQENPMREYIVNALYEQDTARRQQTVMGMMQQKGGLLSQSDLDDITRAHNYPPTVIEDHYAQRYMDHLNWPVGKEETNWLKDAYVQMPAEVEKEISTGVEARARLEFFQTMQQDAHANAEKQSWPSWAVDRLKEASGLYSFIKQHVPGTSWLSLPGDQRREAVTNLWNSPDYRQEYLNFYNTLKADNPAMAKEFADDVLGMTSDQRFLENVMPLISIEGGFAGKTITNIGMRNQIRTAVRQQVLAGISKDNPELAASLSAGNVAEATIQRTWGSIIKRARRADPLQDALDDLPYLFKLGRENIAQEAQQYRSVGMDLAGSQQLLDKYDELIRTFPQMMSDLTHAERIPALAERYRPAMEAAQQQVIDNNKTLASRIWNLSEPWYNPITKSWFVDAFFGKNSQEPFGSLGHAGRVAKENGLTGHDYVGEPIARLHGPPAPIDLAKRIADNKVIFEELRKIMAAPRWSSRAAKSFGGKTRSQIMKEATDVGAQIQGDEALLASGVTKFAPPPGTSLGQAGSGFYIRKAFPVDETAPGMRQYYAKLSTDLTPTGGVLNSFLSRLRTPNETLSDWMTRNREVATFASSRIEKYVFDQAEEIRKLAPNIPFGTNKKAVWDDFERVVNAAREVRDPTNGKIGYTFKTVGELQMKYMEWIHRLPTDPEVAAYFAFKRIQEIDHALRVIDIVSNKYRNGVMSHRMFTIKDGEQVYSPEFDAKSHAEFPSGHTSDTIAIIGDDGKAKVTKIGKLNNLQKARYDWQVKSGAMKAARVYAPTQNPLAGYAGIKDTDHIIWVMTKNIENKALDWQKQLPWRGGGHFISKWDNYIKQIDVKTENIDGEKFYHGVGVNTLMPVINGAVGRAIIGHIEKVRQFLRSATPANLAAAKDIVENTLKMDWKEVYGWFRPTAIRGPDGKMIAGAKPLFSLTEPFQMVRANQNLMNIDKAGLLSRYPEGRFTDATKHGDMSLQHLTEFSQERDRDTLMTLNNKGSISNPAYNWEPAPLLDAIPTMDRAMTKIANTTIMNDMKTQAIETWVREAREGLLASGLTESELQASPLYWFHHGELGRGWDPIRARELETARMQIKQFVGQVSETDAITHAWSQKLVDATYERFPGATRWLSDKGYDATWTAHQLSDPTRLLRSMTFHLKMGLFSIPQLLVQGQTYTNILGIAGPTRAMQGTTAALMWQFTRRNASEAFIKTLDKHATRFGWGDGQFIAARKDAMDTGFFNVGREYSMIDDPMSNRMFKTAWGKFLDMGAWPFTEGERNVRAGAWFTAWKEYAETSGKTIMNNADKLKILDRASLLNGNMNRASNALYQRGWGAFPTQFFTYTIRQAELMWGKRLTPLEKGRLLITNAMMYGLPVGLGITGIPSDVLRQNMIQNGYTPGQNQVESFFTEGAISQLIDSMTGTYYNVGERLGTTGATPVYDLLYGDKPTWEMVMGASGSTLASVFESFNPFYQKVMSTFRGDPGGFNIMAEHYAQIAKEAGSFNNTWRSYIAAATGRLITKKGETLSGKMDLFSSILMGTTGLQPQEATDMYLMSAAAKAEKETQQWAEKRFIEEYHRGLEAYDNKDISNGNAFMANAFAYSDMFAPEEDKPAWMARASKGWETIIDRTKESFGTKHVPPQLKDVRRNQYIQGLK